MGALGPISARPVAAQSPELDYDPPVHAPITDPFRPPPQPWLPGNRGIEYATEPGTPVRAAAQGVVTFAGAVAGSLHVTVSHPDGVRTSYSFLVSIRVRAGSALPKGAVVGIAGARLHVGARRGDAYIDPASLWGGTGPPWVRLVPLIGSRSASRGPPPAPGATTPGEVGPRAGSGPRTGRWPRW